MRIGFVGLGTMGAPMARNLIAAGFEVTVHNRTRASEETLAARGAARAGTPAEAASGADVVITMVSDTPAVEDVLFAAGGVIEGASEGSLVVDMSTIDPLATVDFGRRLAGRGLRLVDAPVSGGSEGAQRGTLAIMCGGDASDVTRARPVLEALGSKVTHIGPLGAGQWCKAVNQVIVGGFYLAVAEGLVLGMKAGLDMDRVLEAIGSGACRSWVLENRASNVLRDEYPLGFRMSLHLKDALIAIRAADRVGAELPLTSMVSDIERRLVERGYGDEDVSAVAREMRRRAGL